MNESFNYLIFIYLYMLSLCMHVYATAHMWSSQDNVQESVLCFDHVDSMDWSQDIRPGSKCLIYYSWNIRNNLLHSFLFKIFFFLLFLVTYLYVCAHNCRCPQRPEVSNSLWNWSFRQCEPPKLGAGNWTQVLMQKQYVLSPIEPSLQPLQPSAFL